MGLKHTLESALGLERCEFDDECDFCDSPSEGSYCRLSHNAEDVTETAFYICGQCARAALDAALQSKQKINAA